MGLEKFVTMPESPRVESSQQERMRTSQWARWAIAIGLIVVVDQASKAWISSLLEFGQTLPLNAWLNLVRVHNPGAAFSFLADAGGWQKWFFIVLGLVAMLWMAWMIHTNPKRPWFCAAMSLLMGGAAGNVWDRVQLGEVVDFIQVHGNWLSLVFAGGFFPSFNVADSAISVGVVLMLVDEWRHARQFQGAEKDSA